MPVDENDKKAVEDSDDDYSLPLSAYKDGKLIDDDYSMSLSDHRTTENKQEKKEKNIIPPQPKEKQWRVIPDVEEKITTKALAEGAMLSAVAFVLAIISTYIPVLSIVGILLFPLPMAILVLRHGLRMGIIGTVVVFVLSAILLGLPQATLLIIEGGLLGLFLGYCFRHRRGPLFTLGIATLIAAIGMVVGLMFSVFVSGLSINILNTELETFVREYIAAFQAQGLENMLINSSMTVEEYTVYLITMTKKLLPAIMIIGSMGMVLVCYLVFVKILRRLRYDIPLLPPFHMWRIDWRFTWGLIIGLTCSWLGNQFVLTWLTTLGNNILYVFFPVLFTCGLSVIVWLTKAMRINMLIKILLLFLTIQFLPYVCFLLVMVGIIDPLFDFRGRLSKYMEGK